MRKLLIFLILITLTAALSVESNACGHDGFYLGAGYNQLFMFSWDDRLTAAGAPSPGKVDFGPGYGAHFEVGYDIPGSRWGIQMPFEYTRIKLNKEEWVNSFQNTVEAVFHIVSWDNGLDIRLVGGGGWAYLSEGSVDNSSNNFGVAFGIGPGIAYYFARNKISAAVTLEVPVRGIYFFGSHLSRSGTFVLAVPIRIGIQVGFP